MADPGPPRYPVSSMGGDSDALLVDDGASHPESEHIGKRPERRRRLESIGVLNSVTLVAAFLVSAMVIIYIAFFWLASPAYGRSNTTSGLWKAIALSNNVEVSLTISSAVLRLAMALQLGVALSIVAGIALENGSVPFRFVPFIVTLRASGKGSLIELLYFILETAHRNHALNAATATLLLTTILAQLTSTFLVSDLGLSPFLNNTQFEKVAYGFQNAPNVSGYTTTLRLLQETAGANYWTSGSTEYPIFSEYSESPSPSRAMQDTGVNLRAFPPFRTSTQRADLHQYEGYTSVLDTRVTCLPPAVFPALSVGFNDLYPSWVTLRLVGSARIGLPPHMTWEGGDLGFNCSVSPPAPTYEKQATLEWAVTICDLGSQGGVTMSSPLQAVSDPVGLTTFRYLVINVTGQGNEWQDAVETPFKFIFSDITNPWTRLSVPGRPALHLSFSMCASSLKNIHIPTNITRSGAARPEPVLVWDDLTRHYNTLDITRLHAGAMGSLSDIDRGVLTLAKRSNWTEGATWAHRFAVPTMIMPLIPTFLFDSNKGVSVCTFCEIGQLSTTFRAHKSHAAILQNILKKTGSLAHAMQALFTILVQRAFYDSMNEFDVSANATFTFCASTKQIPVRMAGMAIVVTMVVVHNVAVLVVVALFLHRKKISMIGNLWQGFGQVAAGDVAPFAARCTAALDKEIVRELKKDGEHGASDVVELFQDVESGRVCLRRRPPPDEELGRAKRFHEIVSVD